MYIPNAENLAKLPALTEEKGQLENAIEDAKGARKRIKEINKEVRLILRGPAKVRKPSKPAVKPTKPAKVLPYAGPA